MTPDRRDVLRGLTAVLPLGVLASLNEYAAAQGITTENAKTGLCQSCNGNGNCTSGRCVNGLCQPATDPCGGRRRYFACKNAAGACCRRRHGKETCRYL